MGHATPVVVLAHAGDALALRVYQLLERRLGAASVHFVPAERLGFALSWQHGLRGNRPFSRLQGSSGLTLDDERPFVLFNRLRHTPMPHFAAADSQDQAYASSEMYALLMSWLQSLGERVVNPPAPPDLCGPRFSRLEALATAARAGFQCVRLSFSSTPTSAPPAEAFRFLRRPAHEAPGTELLVPYLSPVAGRQPVMGCDCDLGQEVPVVIADAYRNRDDISLCADSLRRLQAITGLSLLELRLAPHAEGWRVSHLSAFPEQADGATAAAVASCLAQRAAT